jgi:hypothetical protein
MIVMVCAMNAQTFDIYKEFSVKEGTTKQFLLAALSSAEDDGEYVYIPHWKSLGIRSIITSFKFTNGMIAEVNSNYYLRQSSAMLKRIDKQYSKCLTTTGDVKVYQFDNGELKIEKYDNKISASFTIKSQH